MILNEMKLERPSPSCVVPPTRLSLGDSMFGLVLNAVLGWWWADPAAALVMVPIIVKEGIDGIKARSCCYVPPPASVEVIAHHD
jgi:hypothetical protein